MSADKNNDDEMEFEYKTVDERTAHKEAQEPADNDEAEAVQESAESDDEQTAGAQPENETEAEAEADVPPEGDFDQQQAAEQMMADMDIYTILRMMIGMVAEQAWINLGLRVAPGKEEAEMKLDEARVAIDTLQFIQKKMENELEDDEKRELESLVSTLQLNYVRKS
ncbi:MAG: DUF1844 domain-containing protein [Armatimonadota bacterium]